MIILFIILGFLALWIILKCYAYHVHKQTSPMCPYCGDQLVRTFKGVKPFDFAQCVNPDCPLYDEPMLFNERTGEVFEQTEDGVIKE